MNEAQILARATDLLRSHGLAGWQIRFDHARRRAGCCLYGERVISLSRVLLPHYPPEAVDEVILHEVAHALVGPAHGHDAVWRRKARQIGATPKARLSGDLHAPPAPWVGRCGRCGAGRGLYRVPRRVTSCGKCSRHFDADLILEWTHRGQPAQPGGAYAAELARIRRRTAC